MFKIFWGICAHQDTALQKEISLTAKIGKICKVSRKYALIFLVQIWGFKVCWHAFLKCLVLSVFSNFFGFWELILGQGQKTFFDNMLVCLCFWVSLGGGFVSALQDLGWGGAQRAPPHLTLPFGGFSLCIFWRGCFCVFCFCCYCCSERKCQSYGVFGLFSPKPLSSNACYFFVFFLQYFVFSLALIRSLSFLAYFSICLSPLFLVFLLLNKKQLFLYKALPQTSSFWNSCWFQFLVAFVVALSLFLLCCVWYLLSKLELATKPFFVPHVFKRVKS